jgi:transcriptional regulator with XRE-family HTH domain
MEIDYDCDMKWNERLRQARDAAGVSNTDIAKACKVKPASVTGWMNGETVNIEAQNLLAACRLLKVSPFWVMMGDETETDITVLPESLQVGALDVIRLVALFAQSTDAGKRFILKAAETTDKTTP